MPKKSFVPNAACQRLLNLVLSALKFSLNLVGGKEKSKFTNAMLAHTNGMTLISLVCSTEK